MEIKIATNENAALRFLNVNYNIIYIAIYCQSFLFLRKQEKEKIIGKKIYNIYL